MLQQIQRFLHRTIRNHPAPAVSQDVLERRGRMREDAVVPLFFRILGAGDDTYPGVMRDVSASGANFLSGQALDPGARLHLGVLSQSGERAVELAGRVAYCIPHTTGFSVGFRFDHELDEPTFAILSGSASPEAASGILRRNMAKPRD